MLIDWRAIADHVWENRTLQEACDLLGYDWNTVYSKMRSAEFRRLYVDIAMVASIRNELIEEHGGARITDSSK